MQIKVLLLLLLIACLCANGQRLTCNRYKQLCDRCLSRIGSNPVDNMDALNDLCRIQLRRRYRWSSLTRCDVQLIACRAPARPLSCENLAILSGMERI